MKIKPELLDTSMLIFGKIRTLRHIDKKMYQLIFDKHPHLFVEEIICTCKSDCNECEDKKCKCKKH